VGVSSGGFAYREHLQVVFAAAITGATVAYAILTRTLVRETRRLREIGSEPWVSVYVEPSKRGIGFLEFIVSNVGNGPAYDIKLALQSDWQIFPERYPEVRLSGIGLFKNGIRYLAPGQSLRTFVGKGEDLVKRDTHELPIKLSYRNHARTVTTEDLSISFAHLVGLMSVGEPADVKAANMLERIAGHLRRFGGLSPIPVDVFTQKDRERREREYFGSDETDSAHDEANKPPVTALPLPAAESPLVGSAPAEPESAKSDENAPPNE
jgi:hypothetical protein